jgi:pimeloyl-ACP methyl ester carboxylesterase
MTFEPGAGHRTAVRGVELAWTEAGQGPTAIWAHGLTSSGRGQEQTGVFDWTAVSAEHRLIRYDARGHGRSTGEPTPEHYTWPNLGLDMLELLNRIAAGEQVDGLGASMGTATLLHAANTDPQRFRRLVLTTPPTMGAVRAAHVRGYLDGAALIERSGLAAYEQAGAAAPQPHIYAGLDPTPPAAEVARSLLPAVLRGAALSDLPDADALAAVRSPVLILAWSGDPGHPLSTARYLIEVLPDAELLIADTPMQLRRWPQVAAEFLR